jgi:hypothetical protein
MLLRLPLMQIQPSTSGCSNPKGKERALKVLDITDVSPEAFAVNVSL